MAAPSRITDLSATAASNSPSGSETIGSSLDDYLRGIQAVIRGDLATKGADIASASSTDLGAVQGLYHDITGTTGIASFGTVAVGVWKILKFEGALTLTHNATSLILLGGQNRTTADGDVGFYVSEGSGNWRELAYFKKGVGATLMDLSDPGADRILFWDESANIYKHLTVGTNLAISDTTLSATLVTLGTSQASTSGTSIDFTGIPSGAKIVQMTLSGVSTNGSSNLQIQIGDSGGLETSGYLGAADNQSLNGGQATAFTSGLGLCRTADSGYAHYGIATFTLIDAATNTWAGTWVGSTTGTVTVSFASTAKALSGTLDRISLTTVNGTDAFDAGLVNIAYQV